jgi:hypothetical protein
VCKGLRPGDSGSWVVDPSSGRILGHVASIDAFGEAFIVPFQETLRDIRNSLGAVHVRLPSQDDIDKLRSKSNYPAPPTGPSLMEGVGPRLIRSIVQESTGSASSSTHGSRLQDEDRASNQVDKVDEHPASAPTTTTVTRINSDPTAAPKKQLGGSGIASKFRWERMLNNARHLLHRKPVAKPLAQPPVHPDMALSMQPPIAPLYPQQSMVPPPDKPYYYHPEMLDMPYMSGPLGEPPYALYPAMSPIDAPPPQHVSGDPGTEHKSGHDSGYSSLQPSAQVSPVPSPPRPQELL